MSFELNHRLVGLYQLRRHEGLPLVGDPAFARIKRLVCSRSPVRFLWK